MARLEEICSLITDGSHFSPEDEGVGYPMFSVKDMTPNGFNISGCKKIGEEAYKKLVANGCKPLNDDVVVAKDGSYLKTAFVIKGNPEIALLSSIAILRPKIDLVVPEYLSYFLKSDAVYRTVSLNYITGTALKRIILKGIRKIEVDLPDIGEQEQRAQRLSKVDYLCQLRKQQLDKLDELVKARFLEMFGDLVAPQCEYPELKLVDICADADDIKCGPFGTQLNKDEYKAKGVAVWEIPQINSGFSEMPTHFITEEKAVILNAYSIEPGDIAMSRKGNVGKCGLFPENLKKGIIHSDVLRIRVDKRKVDSCFMMYQLHFSEAVKRQIEMVSSGAIMAGINVTKLKQIKVRIPELENQRMFAAFVERVDQQKQTVQQSLEKLELMKKALMQEYFG